MSKHKTIPALLVLLAFVTFGCEKVINVDLPEHEPSLVASCFLNPDSSLALRLGNTVGILDTIDPTTVEGATVEISASTGETWTLEDIGDGAYRLDSVFPTEGTTYNLRVNATGYPELTGVDRLPVPVPITGLTARDSVSVSEFDEMEGEIELRWTDPADEENFYFISVGLTDTATSTFDTVIYYNPLSWYSDDPALDAGGFAGEGYSISDASFSGQEKVLKMKFENYFLDFDLVVMLVTVSRDYYLYQLSTQAQEQAGFNPFAEPVQIHSNLNGGLGVIGCYSKDFRPVVR